MAAKEPGCRGCLGAKGRVPSRRDGQLDLRDLDIQQFEYGGGVDRDDFGRVTEAMTAHTRILFATPVYWYSMSGRMKVLFDRLTDLITVRKDIGRRLKGRTVFLLACGTDPTLPEWIRGAVPGNRQVFRHGVRGSLLRADQ